MRAKPLEAGDQEFGPRFDRMVALGQRFWPHNVLRATDDAPVIYVELLTQDIRPGIRSLTIAKALARVTPARVVALVGPERHWNELVWSHYDRDRMLDLAASYCVDEVLDLAQMRGEIETGGTSLSVLGKSLPVPTSPDLADVRVQQIGRATAARILRAPRETPELRDNDQYRQIKADAGRYSRLYAALFSTDTLAFVTTHVDYHQWGTGVETAMLRHIPVIHTQSTSALKAYAHFPETTDRHPGLGYRAQLTLELGRVFDSQIWSRRDLLRQT